jgi:hypothetical protein
MFWKIDEKEIVDLRKKGIVYEYSPNQFLPCNHNYPGMGRGVAE